MGPTCSGRWRWSVSSVGRAVAAATVASASASARSAGSSSVWAIAAAGATPIRWRISSRLGWTRSASVSVDRRRSRRSAYIPIESSIGRGARRAPNASRGVNRAPIATNDPTTKTIATISIGVMVLAMLAPAYLASASRRLLRARRGRTRRAGIRAVPKIEAGDHVQEHADQDEDPGEGEDLIRPGQEQGQRAQDDADPVDQDHGAAVR